MIPWASKPRLQGCIVRAALCALAHLIVLSTGSATRTITFNVLYKLYQLYDVHISSMIQIKLVYLKFGNL